MTSHEQVGTYRHRLLWAAKARAIREQLERLRRRLDSRKGPHQ